MLKLVIGSTEVHCDTAQEAADLMRLLPPEPPKPSIAVVGASAVGSAVIAGLGAAPRQGTSGVSAQPSIEITKFSTPPQFAHMWPLLAWGSIPPQSREFLDFLLVNKGNAIPTDRLRDALNAKGIEGIGPSLRGIRRHLESVGIKLDNILVRTEFPGEPSKWRVHDINDDIKKLEAMRSGGS